MAETDLKYSQSILGGGFMQYHSMLPEKFLPYASGTLTVWYLNSLVVLRRSYFIGVHLAFILYLTTNISRLLWKVAPGYLERVQQSLGPYNANTCIIRHGVTVSVQPFSS